MILEVSPLKDGSGKELRCLHDTIQHHFRAVREMYHEPSGPFITSAIELNLDANICLSGRNLAKIVMICHNIRRFWSFQTLELELKRLGDLPSLRKCHARKTFLRRIYRVRMSLHLLLVLQIYLPPSVLCARLRDILYLFVLHSKVCHIKNYFYFKVSGSFYKLPASGTSCKAV